MSHRNESKIISSLAFIINVIFVAIPLDIIRYARMRRKSVVSQVVVITGAGSGLGKRMAEIFALELKAKVAVLDINEEAANVVSDSICASGGIAKAWYCDVADADFMNRTAAEVRECLGDVDIVVCNAAILHFAHTLQLTTEQIQQALNVNVMGPINTIRAFLADMERRNSGQIVGISSIAGYFGETYGLAYCPTKFAVRGIMDCLRMEMRDRKLDGIICTTVCPYFVRTPMILNKGLRPTCRLISFMSIERCTRNVIDAILKEKSVAFVPGWITIIPMFSAYVCCFILNSHALHRKTSLKFLSGKSINEKSKNEASITEKVNDNNYKNGKNNICCCSIKNATRPLHENKDNTHESITHNKLLNSNSDRHSASDLQYYVYGMENYFRLPRAHWFAIILPALALTFAVWYAPKTFNKPYLGFIGQFFYSLGTEHSTLVLAINIFALIVHFGEAEYALLIANELNLNQVCAMKWFIQTFILGFPSLSLLISHRRRQQQRRE